MWESKLTVFLVIAIFLFVVIYNPASAREITVDDNSSGADFQSIQKAVNSSSSGDIILVYPGFYNESVDIGIPNISVLSESEDPEDTLIRAFNISANSVYVSGFSIQEVLNLGKYSRYYDNPVENCTVKNNILKSSVYVDECYNSTIEKNVVFNGGIGVCGLGGQPDSNFTISDNLIFNGYISVRLGPHVTLLNNTLLNSSILLTECGYNKVIGNHISNNPQISGISLWESYVNEIENNTVVNCSNGISMEWLSSQNTINNNTLICNSKGILVREVSGGIISNNTISNGKIGILLTGSSSVGNSAGRDSLLNNSISNNDIGILFEGYSSDNVVINNKVELNRQYGVHINNAGCGARYGQTNQFYNNVFNNTVNFFNDTSSYKDDYTSIYTGNSYTAQPIDNGTGIIPVALNTTKTPGTNIVGGPYFGGNYWAKPDGTGFSQICADSDGDGIGDLPYNITGNDTDYFPLVSVSRSKETIIPVANFSTNITHTLAPLAVQFTDFSRNATAVVWDFNSDGIPDSTERTPVYVFTYPGNYTVNLTVNNTKGMDSKSSTVIVFPAQHLVGKLLLTEYQITTSESDETQPVIYEDRIVWQSNHNENYTLYLYNISTFSEVPIVSINNSIFPDFCPAIYNDRVVWRESGNIYLYNLSTSTKTLISNQLGIYPAIYGDKIVWQGECSGDCIYMYDISSSKQIRVTDNKSISYLPAIHGNRTVWESRANVSGSSNISMYDVSTSRKTQITTNKFNQEHSAIYGDRIVWEDSRNGNLNIYMYDLSTSKEIQITTSGLAHDPAIYGDRIVWQDDRNDKEYIENSDIYMYDLSTKKETQITTNESNQEHPAIYGDKIVWIDYRNGFRNPDIYMCVISEQEEKPPVADFSANITSGNAPLKVLFTDNSTGAPIYWFWDFGDGINSKYALNATHTFTEPGKYDVSLTVTNENGSNTRIIPGYITVSADN